MENSHAAGRMPRKRLSRPTDAELAILSVNWDRGAPISIRQISEDLKKRKPTTYSTTQTLVRIMERKGLVRRGEARYPALYQPTAAPAATRRHLVRDFADRAFGGSLKQLTGVALSLMKKNAGADLADLQ